MSTPPEPGRAAERVPAHRAAYHVPLGYGIALAAFAWVVWRQAHADATHAPTPWGELAAGGAGLMLAVWLIARAIGRDFLETAGRLVTQVAPAFAARTVGRRLDDAKNEALAAAVTSAVVDAPPPPPKRPRKSRGATVARAGSRDARDLEALLERQRVQTERAAEEAVRRALAAAGVDEAGLRAFLDAHAAPAPPASPTGDAAPGAG